MHFEIGSKWSQISKMEPLLGRTVSQIKNRFYQNLKNKDVSQIKYKAEKLELAQTSKKINRKRNHEKAKGMTLTSAKLSSKKRQQKAQFKKQ